MPIYDPIPMSYNGPFWPPNNNGSGFIQLGTQDLIGPGSRIDMALPPSPAGVLTVDGELSAELARGLRDIQDHFARHTHPTTGSPSQPPLLPLTSRDDFRVRWNVEPQRQGLYTAAGTEPPQWSQQEIGMSGSASWIPDSAVEQYVPIPVDPSSCFCSVCQQIRAGERAPGVQLSPPVPVERDTPTLGQRIVELD